MQEKEMKSRRPFKVSWIPNKNSGRQTIGHTLLYYVNR